MKHMLIVSILGLLVPQVYSQSRQSRQDWKSHSTSISNASTEVTIRSGGSIVTPGESIIVPTETKIDGLSAIDETRPECLVVPTSGPYTIRVRVLFSLYELGSRTVILEKRNFEAPNGRFVDYQLEEHPSQSEGTRVDLELTDVFESGDCLLVKATTVGTCRVVFGRTFCGVNATLSEFTLIRH